MGSVSILTKKTKHYRYIFEITNGRYVWLGNGGLRASMSGHRCEYKLLFFFLPIPEVPVSIARYDNV